MLKSLAIFALVIAAFVGFVALAIWLAPIMENR